MCIARTLVCFRPNGGTTKTASVYQINSAATIGIPTSWVDWAIGGISLYINDPTIGTSKTLYDAKVSSEMGALSNGANYRSAIGYKSGGQLILAVMQNVTPFDVRSVMISLGCIDGVMLDGSTASKMRYKDAAGAVGTVSFGSRATCSAITVNGATWI
jgi:hypothetical protein